MIGFAEWNMRRELAALWTKCFHDPERCPRYFLNNYFSPRDCLVYRVGGRVVSAVYLLPAQILSGTGRIPAHYIFAAATLPDFRSHGYMASLLACAAMIGARRGDRFSVLLPSGDSLYRFYGASGYSEFFRTRILSAAADRLRGFTVPAGQGRILFDSGSLNALRNRCLAGQNGSVLWSGRMFHFAAGMSAVYGDRLICASADGIPAYALCRMEADGICSVLEMMAGKGAFPALAGEILRWMPAREYRFRLPAGTGPFPGEGKTVRGGMIRPIGGELFENFRPKNPYLGLTLD